MDRHSSSNNYQIDLNSLSDPSGVFELIEVVGSGTYGDVYKARHVETSQVAAVKIIKLEPGDNFAVIQQEILMMKSCVHPNIVAFYGSYLRRDKLWICMEYCGGGSLQDIYHVTGPLSEPQISLVCRETLKGLSYLHSMGKMHRDIKGANILLTNLGDVKLADFGVSAQITATICKRKSFIGSPYWMAPEVAAVERKGGYNQQCDVWSVGITAIELAELQPPMFDLHPMRALFLMSKSNFKPPTLKDKNRWTEEYKSFVKAALTRNPKKRPSAEKLLEHSFVHQELSRDMMRDLLERAQNPNNFSHFPLDDPEEEKLLMDVPQRITSTKNSAVYDDNIRSDQQLENVNIEHALRPALTTAAIDPSEDINSESTIRAWSIMQESRDRQKFHHDVIEEFDSRTQKSLLEMVDEELNQRELGMASLRSPPDLTVNSASVSKPVTSQKEQVPAHHREVVGDLDEFSTPPSTPWKGRSLSEQYVNNNFQKSTNQTNSTKQNFGHDTGDVALDKPPEVPPRRKDRRRPVTTVGLPSDNNNSRDPFNGIEQSKLSQRHSVHQTSSKPSSIYKLPPPPTMPPPPPPSSSQPSTRPIANGLPPTPKVHMGACFSKVFNGCPLNVNCAVSWIHPETRDQHILLGCDEGIYTLNLNELHDACMDHIFPRKTTWMFVIKDVLMTLSGKATHLYRHDLVSLHNNSKNGHIRFGLPMDSMINKIPEKFVPRKFTASTKVSDTRGCIACCIGRNPFNGYKYLCGATQSGIFLMQWYNPMNKFMLLKQYEIHVPPRLSTFEMIITPGLEYPMLCVGVRKSSNPLVLKLDLINLNSSASWFGDEDLSSTIISGQGQLDLACVTQLDKDTILVSFDNVVQLVDLDGNLKSNVVSPSQLVFDFKIKSIGKLNVFHLPTYAISTNTN